MGFLFSEKFPSGIVEVLEDDGFDNLPALLSADRHDLDGLKLKVHNAKQRAEGYRKSDPGLGPFYLWTFFFTSEPNVSCGG